MAESTSTRRVHGYCGLCIARCGCVAVVEDGRFTRLDPDPTHPTGQALCAKGRAAPELVYHPERLTHPLRRTRPKGDPDPGWERIGWDEALNLTAAAMRGATERHGPEAVAFTLSSPSTTAIADSAGFIRRLANAFGTPNAAITLDVCGWGRTFATRYTYGVGSVGTGGGGGAMPDIENSGCLILWGYNPSNTRLTHATAVVKALKRGMRLIVIDPRHAGLANKADLWLRVRPGTDGALALGLANVMIEREWYDRDFIRSWSDGPLLVRSDTGRLLTERDLEPTGDPRRNLAWDTSSGHLVPYDTATGRYYGDSAGLALEGEYRIATPQGEAMCHPAFELYTRLCRHYPPEAVEGICRIPRAQVEEAARLIWHARAVSYYAWSGHEQHANVTQTARAMSLLYALTGCFDMPGGNVLFPAPAAAPITGEELMSAGQTAATLGLAERPLGPARWGYFGTRDLYRAILEGKPYPVRAVIGFGANMLLAHADGRHGREALSALEFYAHSDLFMNPTAELADVVLPVASSFEREALKIGFEISEEAQSLIQLRPAVVPPPGEARPDTDIIFDLAARLGLAEQFWNGDIDAAYRHQLGPTGVTLAGLRAASGGVRVPLQTRHAKHAALDANGATRGFATPSRKVEFYSQTFLDHGYAPLPDFQEPQIGPVSRPDLAARFPLILTSAKPTLFCQTQHRALPSLRKRALHPEVELHPAAAQVRGVANGDWVSIETPEGRVRARARLNDSLDPQVVVGEHGWWQACAEIGAPGYDPFGPDGANLNMIIGTAVRDPVSGTASHRSYLCEIRRAPEAVWQARKKSIVLSIPPTLARRLGVGHRPFRSRPMPKLQIIGAPQSNYVCVVRIACLEKGVPYTLVPAVPHSPEVDAIHPFGKIPVMRHGDVTLSESRAICFYIDHTFEGSPLAPRDPVEGARTEEWISLVNTHIDPLLVRQYLGAHFFPGTPDGSPDRAAIDAALPKMEQRFAVLDGAVAKTGHLVGDTFTLADINLLPILFYMDKMPESSAILRRHSNLRAYFDRHMSRPSAREATPPPFPGRQG